MKILFIAKFVRVEDEGIIAKALEMNGHEVICLEVKGYTNYEFMQKVREHKPDIVLFTKLDIMQSNAELIQSMKDYGVPTVSWTFDLILGHPIREDRILTECKYLWGDYAFMTDGGRDEEYKKIGVNKVTLRQGIPEEFNYIAKKDDKYDFDVVFVGSVNGAYPYRQKMLTFLKKEYGKRFRWYGVYDSSEIRGHELNKLYASAKVIVGDSMCADNYWSNRVYEVTGRGGFFIHAEVPGLEKEFEYYKEIVPYKWNDFESLQEKIDYFVSHDKERDKIRQAAFERTHKNYQYHMRTKLLTDKLIHDGKLSN